MQRLLIHASLFGAAVASVAISASASIILVPVDQPTLKAAIAAATEFQPEPPTCPLGDLDCDGDIDAGELGILLGAWGLNDEDADLNDDGIVAAGDLAILLGAWS